MEKSLDAHRRPRSIRVALWVGWLWFALFFFNPGTILNMGRNFLLWLPCALLFGIPLKLIAEGKNGGRIALNVILPIVLLFTGFNILRLMEVLLPDTVFLFLFMGCLVWLPLLVVLICVNRQSAREWFQSGRTAMPAAL